MKLTNYVDTVDQLNGTRGIKEEKALGQLGLWRRRLTTVGLSARATRKPVDPITRLGEYRRSTQQS